MKKIDVSTPKHPNMFALVDDGDFARISKYKWFCWESGSTFYALRHAKTPSSPNKMMYMHRQVLSSPAGVSTDHKNHNGLDNRKSNLRPCTAAQNMSNQKWNRRNTSGYRGVTWFSRDSKWKAQIMVEGKNIYLGLFTCPVKAAVAYDKAAIKYHGEFASTNSS